MIPDDLFNARQSVVYHFVANKAIFNDFAFVTCLGGEQDRRTKKCNFEHFTDFI